MRYWFDTEFIEDGRTIDLISVGIVAEDGREYYAVSSEADLSRADDWVRTNVLPHIEGYPTKPRRQIASEVGTFFLHPEGERQIWAYYGDYDWVALCQLWGRMIDLPEGMPMFAMDVKQLAVQMGHPALPKQMTTEHNALEDARWTRKAYLWLMQNTGKVVDVRA